MIEAGFYDGVTSRRHNGRIALEAQDVLWVHGEGFDLRYPLAEVRVAPRVGNSRRMIYLPGGALCEVHDNDALDRLLERSAQRGSTLLHKLESRTKYVLAALLLSAGFLYAGVQFGIPAVASEIALRLPPSTEKVLGEQALAVLDGTLFSPSRLGEGRQQELRALFQIMVREAPDGSAYRLEFRASEDLGANAFALPSGVVVITDGLVELASRDEQLIAVLAHEIGHVRGRHTLRHLLQSSAAGLLIAAVTGDVASISALGAALPATLLEAKFSREFETEADTFALDYLSTHGIAPRHFADLLLRLAGASGDSRDSSDFLSTHPASRERAARFLAASKTASPSSSLNR